MEETIFGLSPTSWAFLVGLVIGSAVWLTVLGKYWRREGSFHKIESFLCSLATIMIVSSIYQNILIEGPGWKIQLAEMEQRNEVLALETQQVAQLAQRSQAVVEKVSLMVKTNSESVLAKFSEAVTEISNFEKRLDAISAQTQMLMRLNKDQISTQTQMPMRHNKDQISTQTQMPMRHNKDITTDIIDNIIVKQTAKKIDSTLEGEHKDKTRYEVIYSIEFLDKIGPEEEADRMRLIDTVTYHLDKTYFVPSDMIRVDASNNFSLSLRVWGQTRVEIEVILKDFVRPLSGEGLMKLDGSDPAFIRLQ